MEHKRAKVLFDLKKAKTKCMVQTVWTTIDYGAGTRTTESEHSHIPSDLVICDLGDFYAVDILSEFPELHSELLEKMRELPSTRLSDSVIRQKEIRIYFDVDHPELYLIIGVFSSWESSGYRTGTPTLHMLLPEDRLNFISNNGMRLPLSAGAEALEDCSVLSEADRAFIDEILLRQERSDWILPPSAGKKNTAPEPAVLDEIRALFGAGDVIGFDELKIIRGSDDALAELEELCGMEGIKREIRVLEARLSYTRRMEAQGFFSDDTPSLHMSFLGAPGTGKTTVARVLTGLFYRYGCIKKNKCVEVGARQLVGGYVGQTGSRTAKIIEAARGGVLFIDEAYTLVPDGNTQNDFSYEAVAQLLKEMEDSRGELIVILAGYERDMERLFEMNEGMRSRVNKNIIFENYSAHDAMEILLSMLRREQYRIDRGALEKLLLLIKKCRLSELFSNGRFVRNLYEHIYEHHALRVYNKSAAPHEVDTFVAADVDDRDVCEPMLHSVKVTL